MKADPATQRRPLALFLDFSDQPCLIIGAGQVAARKAASLLKSGAKLTVIAPSACQAMNELMQDLSYRQRSFQEADIEGQKLVVAATDNAELNTLIAAKAKQQGLMVDVANPGHLSNAVIPAVIDRSPLHIALFSQGTSPTLIWQLRRQLEAFIPPSYGRLAAFAGFVRDHVKQALPELKQRQRFWREWLAGPAHPFMTQDETTALQLTQQRLAQFDMKDAGCVTLVGAGPGDPELLTLKALRSLQQADVIVHDRLVGPGVLALIPEEVERINVGKAPGYHSHQQDQINQILIKQARLGKRVVRLKGGDPFIFGRGGEEIEALTAANIRCEVLPGITAAIGSASISGIPLTHREWSHGCIILPGQLSENATLSDWNHYAQARQTLVFYMILNNLQKICRMLLAAGMKPDMPTALIQQATLPEQKISTATLAEWSLPNELEVKPGILIIGETVRLSPYFGNAP